MTDHTTTLMPIFTWESAPTPAVTEAVFTAMRDALRGIEYAQGTIRSAGTPSDLQVSALRTLAEVDARLREWMVSAHCALAQREAAVAAGQAVESASIALSRR